MDRSHKRYLILGASLCMAAGAAVLAVLWSSRGGGPSQISLDVVHPAEVLAAYRPGQAYQALEVTYPFNGAVFPPEIPAPKFRWKERDGTADAWVIAIGRRGEMPLVTGRAGAAEWAPSEPEWQAVKTAARERDVEITVLGVRRAAPSQALSAGAVRIATAKDEVGTPIFYREVNLPFLTAVKDPSRIRWRFGPVSSPKPPIVLQNLPVCGNCHSFSADGSVMGMDVDYANDKGSYAIIPVAAQMVLDKDKIITWSDYQRSEKELTFGLLSQVSPDGRYVISTVKDRSVFVPRADLAFSQLFFPLKGILVVYDRRTKTFNPLPGAADPQFVQSNPAWSPDGRYVVFARSKVYPLKTFGDKVLLTEDECQDFLRDGKTFLFDLYRVPFNEGKGGQAEPIAGASRNGVSNYFAKYSPDGKWLVFCKAKSFMLLQPDSELYIMPAAGGEPRRMECNTGAMNSWHSWSANSRWLVFSSKVNGPYTQLCLTHIDEQGRSSPPVVLEHFTDADRAANIPEFVAIAPAGIAKISERFVDEYSYVRAAQECFKQRDFEGAERSFRKALEVNPKYAVALDGLGAALVATGRLEEGRDSMAKAVECDPSSGEARCHLGQVLQQLGQVDRAIEQYKKALDTDPNYAAAHFHWGSALLTQQKLDDAAERFRKVLKIDPSYAEAHVNLGGILVNQGRYGEGMDHCKKALELGAKSAFPNLYLGIALSRQRKFDLAIHYYQKALEMDPQCGPARDGLEQATRMQAELEQALARLRDAIAADPGNYAPRLDLAKVLNRVARYEEALAQLEKALEIAPKAARVLNDLAWLLATCPTDKLRNSVRAVELGKQACELSGNKAAVPLDTLAAAYAEAGQFSQAVQTAAKALELARTQLPPEGQEKIARRMESYKANKPWRQD